MRKALWLLAMATAGAHATALPAAQAPLWDWALPLLYLAAAAALLAGAVFSGSEIGIFSLSRVRLRLRMARGDRRALLLNEWLQEPTYALEGLLILQNLASFGFAAAVTAILHHYGFSETPQTLISIALVTPMTLVFADILPKDIFNRYADVVMYRMVPLMKWFFRAITAVGLLPLVNGLSQLSTWLVGAGRRPRPAVAPRSEILMLFQESADTGVLTGTQQDLVQRALRLGRISVREVMMQWNRVIGVPSSISRDGFRALVRRYTVSRMPVLGRSTTEVLGIVEVLDALTPRISPPAAPPAQERDAATRRTGDAATESPAPSAPLAPLAPSPPRPLAVSLPPSAPPPFKITDYLQPAMTLIGEQSVRSAITLMQRARQTLAIVVDHHGRAVGLVTMKDLIEELVGDLESW